MKSKLCFLCIVAAALLLPSVGVSQQADLTIRWEPTLESAQRLATQTNRLVLIYFSGPSCVYCKRMEAEVLAQPTVATAINADYVAVKVVADQFPTTAKQYGISKLPTTVVATPQGQVLDSKQGYVPATEYTARLSQVAMEMKRRQGAVVAQIPAATTPAAANPSTGVSPAVTPQYPNPIASQPGYTAQTPAPVTATPSYAAQTPAPVAVTPNYAAQTPSPTAAAPSYGTQIPNAVAAAPSYAVQTPTPIAVAPSYATPSYAAQTPAPVATTPNYATQTPAPVTAAPSYATQTPAPVNVAPQSPAGNPTFGLDGFCPVTLAEKHVWTPGDRRIGMTHRGRTYLFTGEEERRRFYADPDRYAPVVSGNDVVLATEQGQAVPGLREHGVFFGGRVYLFSSEDSLKKFSQNPKVYSNQALEAMRNGANRGQQLR